MNKTRKRIVLTVITSILLALIIWTLWGNTALELNTYTISSNRLPKEFDGYRIAHVSDLHNTEIGKDNRKLISMLKEAQPDIIAITGDLIDSRKTKIDIAIKFAEEAVKIAPCYYITGNHEARVADYEYLKHVLEEIGVNVLEDEQVPLKKGDAEISLIGVDDQLFAEDYLLEGSHGIMENKLEKLVNEKGSYTILLSHRPELFDVYADYKVDLVLSGHTHGGQVILPFIGGLVAPKQGWFPEYDAGLFTENSTNMIVSRGIGNSIIPLRFNNRPEVILVELKSEQ